MLPLLWLAMQCWVTALGQGLGGAKTYFGFDKNDYPGDDLLPKLRPSFAYTGYWLNTPPGANSNSWTSKRAILERNGFGFLILFNGRLDSQLTGNDAAALGRSDAAEAIAAATREGFRPGMILFLDQEEGGRLLPEQSAYLFAWVEAIRASPYKPGVYCSGLLTPDGPGKISTARDILNHGGNQPPALWVVNDLCPPSPGCKLPKSPLAAGASGVAEAQVWQFARSPRTEFARQCGASYAADKNCYVPGIAHSDRTFVDLNVSSSPDPSGQR